MKWKFIRYEWDGQLLTYVRAPIHWRGFWQERKTWIRVIGIGLILFLGGLPWWRQHFLQVAEARDKRVRRELQVLSHKLSETESRLRQLYERYNDFYVPIVGVSPLSEGAWRGGTGGAMPLNAWDLALYRAEVICGAYAQLHAEMQSKANALRRYPYLMPIEGPIVSGFGFRRDPFHGHWQMHTGVDVSAAYGAPVKAAASGVIIYAGWDNGGGYGIQVEISHLNGFVTKYAHLSRVAVQVGDTVERGRVIGYIGSTGYSVAPHLHYEVIQDGIKVDPRKFLPL